jgi:hypothetical protein
LKEASIGIAGDANDTNSTARDFIYLFSTLCLQFFPNARSNSRYFILSLFPAKEPVIQSFCGLVPGAACNRMIPAHGIGLTRRKTADIGRKPLIPLKIRICNPYHIGMNWRARCSG